MGALQGGGPPKMGNNAFGPTNNWHVCSLILRKISKISASRCQVLRLKCTAGELTALPKPRAVLNGPTSTAREGTGGRGREGKVKESEGETRRR